MKQIKFISIKRLKIHEFDTTFRLLYPHGENWFKKRELISEIEAKAIKSFITVCAQILMSYLVVSSLTTGSLVSVTLFGSTASIPLAYALGVSSFIFVVAALQLNHLSAAISMKTRSAAKFLLHGFNVGAYDLSKGRDDNALGIPVFSIGFLKEAIPILTLLGYLFIASLFVAILPILAYGAYLYFNQLELLVDKQLPLLERATSIVGILLLITSALSVVLFHLPIPFRKDTFSIRWGFLVRLHPLGPTTESVRRWLEEKK